MKNFWKNKRVLVTGGNGFIGSHVVSALKKRQAKVRIPTGDLTTVRVVDKSVKNTDIVLHLASKVAGIQYNIGHPVEMFESNVLMTRNILNAALEHKVDRVLIMSSACVYRRYAPVPTKETEGFVDDPEETNLGYGWSKRVMELMASFYHREYGMKIAIARPYNTYGPNDKFNSEFSHVIPGIIKRLYQGENPLIIWGSGKQTRSFLYIEDCVKGILDLTEKYPKADPINIGGTEETSITTLARTLVKLSGLKTKIVFDVSKPDGQPRRSCDTKKANKLIGFKAETSLEVGLKKTIEWYLKQHSSSLPVTKSRVSSR